MTNQRDAAEAIRPVVQPSNGFLSFWYKNWRGEVSERVVIPMRIYHGATEWHLEPQWLLEAWDMEKHAARAFAMADMQAPPSDQDKLQQAAIEEARSDGADDEAISHFHMAFYYLARQTGERS